MSPGATRPVSDSLAGDLAADSGVIAKKRRIDEDIRNLYEDFGIVMDDYQGTDEDIRNLYAEVGIVMDDYQETEYGEDDYEEDEDGIDEGDDYDQDEEECMNSQCQDGEQKDEKSGAAVKENSDNDKDWEGPAKAIDDKDGGTAREEAIDVAWHPLFRPDVPRVIILSNDNKKLCVDRHILPSHR